MIVFYNILNYIFNIDFNKRQAMVMRKKQNGFTLVEILVALAISSIIGLSIMAIYSISARSFEVAQRKQIAMENARTSLDQVSEWVKWGGFDFELPGSGSFAGFAGIYPCSASPTDTGSGAACGLGFNTSFGVIAEMDTVLRRLNFYFQPDNTTDYPDDALLMMDIVDISDPAFPVIDTVVISDRVMMPGTNIPDSNPVLAVPNFVEFYDINYNVVTFGSFPMNTGKGVLLKLSLVGINWSDYVDSGGTTADFVAIPYTVTVFTRNYMKKP